MSQPTELPLRPARASDALFDKPRVVPDCWHRQSKPLVSWPAVVLCSVLGLFAVIGLVKFAPVALRPFQMIWRMF